jgi:glycosyltransferase involved in cell wall biosynthesis
MRIIIDLQGAQTTGSRFRGIGRYCLNFAKAFVVQRREHEVMIVLNAAFPDSVDAIRQEFSELLPAKSIRIWNAPQPVRALESENADRRQQAEVVREAFFACLNPDWVIVSSLFEGLVDDAVTSIGRLASIQTAVVLYDLIPWIYPDPYLADQTVRRWYLEKLDHLRRADLLLGISASSAKEAVDYLGFAQDSSINISTAANDFFQPQQISPDQRKDLARRYGLNRAFVMYTGGIDLRKNIEGLIKAWSVLPMQLRSTCQLAVVCHADDHVQKRLHECAADCGLEAGEMILTGFVPEEDLLALYNLCDLFVFPSWHEGFGLPALEAMQCGKPVLAANRASLPEVVGREDTLFDPFDTHDIAEKITRALTDPLWSDELARHGLNQAKRFSWQETARRAWEALESRGAYLPASKASSSVRRPRLAYISPLPPERSGIADYSAELLRDLTRWYDIDVVVRDHAGMSDADIRATCGVRSTDYFIAHHQQYDRVLYHFGNSEFHEHMFELFERIPGCVVLHDFFLSGIQAWSEVHEWRPKAWVHSLYHSHGYHAVLARYHAADTKDVVHAYPANLQVLQRALGVIVHSEFNRQLAAQWYGEDAANDWRVIPLLRVPATLAKAKARQRLAVPEGVLVIASFGILGETKLNHRLLEAFLFSALAMRPDVMLVFVGMAVGEYSDQIHRTIDQAQAKATIQITGWAEADEYRDWLQAADIAVQLRANSRGETSAAVLDCLNYGLATIVNAHGSMAELATDTVWMFPDDFATEQLVEALETLAIDEKRRLELGTSGRQHIREVHNPRRCAEQYADAIEVYYHKYGNGLGGVGTWLASKDKVPDEKALSILAKCLAQNNPPHPRLKHFFIDISDFVYCDEMSVFKSFVLSVIKRWLIDPPESTKVELAYAKPESGYFYARNFATSNLGIPNDVLMDEPIDFAPQDTFLVFVLHEHTQLLKQQSYDLMRQCGVRIVFCADNLMPSQRTNRFEAGYGHTFEETFCIADGIDSVYCNSKVDVEILWNRLKVQHPQGVHYLNIADWGTDYLIDATSKVLDQSENQALLKDAAHKIWSIIQVDDNITNQFRVLKN